MAREELDLSKRLEGFFSAAADLWAAPQHSSSLTLDADRLALIFAGWREPMAASRAAAFTNPWETAGLGSDEVRISSVLASLWDERKYGDEARAFLARFLSSGECVSDDALSLIGNYRVQTEHCLNGAIKDRVDITVETKSAIIGIEVKIYASERDEQLPDYVSAIARRAELMRRKHAKVVFLSPYASRNLNHTVPHISWRKLAECAALADATTRSGRLIQQFGEFCRDLGR